MRDIKLLPIIAAMALSACQKMTVEEAGKARTKAIEFHLKGDFARNYEDMSRASVRLEEDNTAGITDIWIQDYVEGELMHTVHQQAGDADFGHPVLNLTYGDHDILFIASKSTSPVLSESALSWQKVLDTFTIEYPVTIQASTNGNRAPELQRAVSGLKVHMEDEVPAEAKEIVVMMKRSTSLLLPTLAPGELSESFNSGSFPASWAGKTGGEFTTYTLCPDDGITTDVRITVLNNSGDALSDFVVPDVTLKKNRITTLSGKVFGHDDGFAVTINDSWDDTLNVSF